MKYRLMISIEVVEFIERLPSKKRNLLRNVIAEIGSDPWGKSEAEDRDATGRRLEIAIAGDFAFTYWIDDVDRQVKILDVHAADL